MVRQYRNHFRCLYVARLNATREQPPTREWLRLLGQSAYKGTPFLVDGKVAKTVQRSVSRLPVDTLSLILEGTEGLTVTTDLEDHESVSSEEGLECSPATT